MDALAAAYVFAFGCVAAARIVLVNASAAAPARVVATISATASSTPSPDERSIHRASSNASAARSPLAAADSNSSKSAVATRLRAFDPADADRHAARAVAAAAARTAALGDPRMKHRANRSNSSTIRSRLGHASSTPGHFPASFSSRRAARLTRIFPAPVTLISASPPPGAARARSLSASSCVASGTHGASRAMRARISGRVATNARQLFARVAATSAAAANADAAANDAAYGDSSMSHGPGLASAADSRRSHASASAAASRAAWYASREPATTRSNFRAARERRGGFRATRIRQHVGERSRPRVATRRVERGERRETRGSDADADVLTVLLTSC